MRIACTEFHSNRTINVVSLPTLRTSFTSLTTLRPLYAAFDELGITRNLRAHIPYRTLSKVEEDCGKFSFAAGILNIAFTSLLWQNSQIITGIIWRWPIPNLIGIGQKQWTAQAVSHVRARVTCHFSTISCTYILTPWSRFPLEKLPGIQLVKKFGSLLHFQVPATFPILSHFDPVHTPTSHYLKIQLNITLPSMPGSPKWSLSFRFPHLNPEYVSPLPHTRYMPSPSHSSRFNL